MQYSDYVNYFANIAATHPQIDHQAAVGSQTFCISIEEALTKFRTAIKEKGFFMRLIQYTYSLSDNKSQNSLKNIMGGFVIGRHYRKDDFDDMVEAISDSEKIIDDIIERMVADSKNAHPLFARNFDRPNDVEVTEWVRPVENYIGWICTFKIDSFYRNCIDHPDAPAWSDGGLTPY